MSGRVSGKVAFITGVARGQGRSHAIRLAEEGADIIGVDVPRPIDDMPYPLGTQEELDETIELVRKLGRRIVAKPADVRDRDAMRRVVDEGVAELGRLDIVVANAGICPLGPTPPGTFLDVLDVDLVGLINAYNVAYPHLPDGASMRCPPGRSRAWCRAPWTTRRPDRDHPRRTPRSRVSTCEGGRNRSSPVRTVRYEVQGALRTGSVGEPVVSEDGCPMPGATSETWPR